MENRLPNQPQCNTLALVTEKRCPQSVSLFFMNNMSTTSEYDPKTENRAVVRLALYILWFVLVSSLLLSINTWMIYALSQGVAKLLPNIPGISILVQLVIFIGPMVLLYLEWFAWDVIYAHRLRARRSRISN